MPGRAWVGGWQEKAMVVHEERRVGYGGSQGGWEKKSTRADQMQGSIHVCPSSPPPPSLSCQPAIVGVQDPHLGAGGQG